MLSPKVIKTKRYVHHSSLGSVTGRHKKILAVLVSVVFSVLIFTNTSASAASKYPCENLSAKDCYKIANSWAYPGELNNGLKGLKAELALAKSNKDEKRYKEISSIHKKMVGKYKSLKSKAKSKTNGKGKPESSAASSEKPEEKVEEKEEESKEPKEKKGKSEKEEKN